MRSGITNLTAPTLIRQNAVLISLEDLFRTKQFFAVLGEVVDKCILIHF